MASVIWSKRRLFPALQGIGGWIKDLNDERIAICRVAGMLGAAIAARASGEAREQINPSEEVDEVAGSNWARLHEVLVRIQAETRAHEHIQHIMHQRLRLFERHAGCGRQPSRQIGIATVMIRVMT